MSFLAVMLVDKFAFHTPLYRQHERLEQNGIVLARSTLNNLVKRAIALVKPIYESQLEHILLSKLLAIDETPIKAGREKKGKMKQGYFWPIYGDCAEICFTYSASRSVSHLKGALGEFNGTILSDGYKAYESYADTVNSTTHALCWVHMRRGFDQAEKSEPQACAEALAMIGSLGKVLMSKSRSFMGRDFSKHDEKANHKNRLIYAAERKNGTWPTISKPPSSQCNCCSFNSMQSVLFLHGHLNRLRSNRLYQSANCSGANFPKIFSFYFRTYSDVP